MGSAGFAVLRGDTQCRCARGRCPLASGLISDTRRTDRLCACLPKLMGRCLRANAQHGTDSSDCRHPLRSFGKPSHKVGRFARCLELHCSLCRRSRFLHFRRVSCKFHFGLGWILLLDDWRVAGLRAEYRLHGHVRRVWRIVWVYGTIWHVPRKHPVCPGINGSVDPMAPLLHSPKNADGSRV